MQFLCFAPITTTDSYPVYSVKHVIRDSRGVRHPSRYSHKNRYILIGKDVRPSAVEATIEEAVRFARLTYCQPLRHHAPFVGDVD